MNPQVLLTWWSKIMDLFSNEMNVLYFSLIMFFCIFGDFMVLNCIYDPFITCLLLFEPGIVISLET